MNSQDPLNPSSQKWLTKAQCADRYGFSIKHWLRLVDSGKAQRPVYFGRLVRWNVDAIEEWDSRGWSGCSIPPGCASV